MSTLFISLFFTLVSLFHNSLALPRPKTTCPPGWSLWPPTDECHLYVGPSTVLPRGPLLSDYNNFQKAPGLLTGLSYRDASERCHTILNNSTLVELSSANHTVFVFGLLPDGEGVWVEGRYSNAKKITKQWVAGRGRTPMYLPWDVMNGEPSATAGSCAYLWKKGNALISGPGGVGGNNKLMAEDCGVKHAFVCSRPRVAIEIKSVNGITQPGQVIQVALGSPLVLQFVGVNMNARPVYISLQTVVDGSFPLPARSAMPCGSVTSLSGISKVTQPRTLLVSTSDSVSFTPSLRKLCNGTCTYGNITMTANTPWRIGDTFSICYAIGKSSKDVPGEYFRDAIQMKVKVVQEISSFLKDVCTARTNLVESVRYRQDDSHRPKRPPGSKPFQT